eukprot:3471779-Amphidinium_carterae.1
MVGLYCKRLNGGSDAVTAKRAPKHKLTTDTIVLLELQSECRAKGSNVRYRWLKLRMQKCVQPLQSSAVLARPRIQLSYRVSVDPRATTSATAGSSLKL